MIRSSLGLTEKGIERILELSADAHIQRRQTAKDSPAFQYLSGLIAAYGKALALFTALQQREEFYSLVAQGDTAERPAMVS